MSSVTRVDVQRAVRALGLAGRPLCVHASLRSFGFIEGGARALVDALLAERCTVLVPTFSTTVYEVWPVPPDPIERNGLSRRARPEVVPSHGSSSIYTLDSTDIDRDMGAVAAAVLAEPAHARGDHPLNSFTALGPLAHDLIARQGPWDVYAPLEALAAMDGAILLMGVGLDRMTLLHAAEQRAGRGPFIRWARGSDGHVVRVQVGGCSDGFTNFAPVLAGLATEANVGRSRWTVFSAAAALEAAIAAIRADATITRCRDRTCARCRDAVLGGPTSGSLSRPAI